MIDDQLIRDLIRLCDVHRDRDHRIPGRLLRQIDAAAVRRLAVDLRKHILRRKLRGLLLPEGGLPSGMRLIGLFRCVRAILCQNLPVIRLPIGRPVVRIDPPALIGIIVGKQIDDIPDLARGVITSVLRHLAKQLRLRAIRNVIGRQNQRRLAVWLIRDIHDPVIEDILFLPQISLKRLLVAVIDHHEAIAVDIELLDIPGISEIRCDL